MDGGFATLATWAGQVDIYRMLPASFLSVVAISMRSQLSFPKGRGPGKSRREMCTYVHALYMCMHAKVDKRRPICLPCFLRSQEPKQQENNASYVPSIFRLQTRRSAPGISQARWVGSRVRSGKKKSVIAAADTEQSTLLFFCALYAFYAGRQSFLFLVPLLRLPLRARAAYAMNGRRPGR